jgi:FkbM family methyltransferase
MKRLIRAACRTIFRRIPPFGQTTTSDADELAGFERHESDFAVVEQVIEDVYEKIVLRPVDSGSMEHWRSVLRSDFRQLGNLIEFLLRTDEFANVSRRFLHHYISPRKLPLVNDNSQNGETGILLREMIGRTVHHKFVVDVGAYGRAGSNSYDLMRHFGWRGLLIEPNPHLLTKIREEFAGLDYRLVGAAVTGYSGTATLHLGVHDEISSIHRHATEQWGPVYETCTVAAERLPTILEINDVPREFGLLSIDTEGESSMSLLEDVFECGYRPTWVIMEVFEALKVGSLDDVELAPEVKSEYRLVARTFPNLILEARCR